ncbi:hypothetical protein [Ferruginibacter sp. SUN106]|uniref:hypothetical protein n=1 Tax=Ferruginibacter sp. SUN106 TaxID=2978348 RepID=UPI003D3615C3
MKQHWGGTEVIIVPETEVDFYSKEIPLFTTAFIKDSTGNFNQVVVRKRDKWNKIEKTLPTKAEWKAVKGKYQSMKIASLTIFLIGYTFSFAQTISPYYKALNSKKHKYFYYYFHRDSVYNLPAGATHEYVYNVWEGSKDTVLEKEITYNFNKQAIVIKQYGITSKNELIEEDNYEYNSSGLLQKQTELSQGYYTGHTDTVIVLYSYDAFNRLLRKEKKERYNDETVEYTYVSNSADNRLQETIQYRGGEGERDHYFYGPAGKLDSVQHAIRENWYQTAQYEYDSSTNTTNIYSDYRKLRVLQTVIKYNSTGDITYKFNNRMTNWNKTRWYNVEIYTTYYADGAVKEQQYFIKGKKRFSKIHLYR